MTKNDFKRCMRQGLGRCAVHLQSAKDIDKFKDTVRWGCLHSLSFDTQCEGTRAAYIYFLTSFFGDDAYFVSPAVYTFLNIPSGNYDKFAHICQLLGLFAEKGNSDALTALREKYSSLLTDLSKKRYSRSYDYERDNFECICIVLTAAFGRNAFLGIAGDISTLLINNSLYDVWDFDCLFSFAKHKFGKREFKSLLINAAKKSQSVLSMYKKYLLCEKTPTPPFPQKAPDVEALLAEVNESGSLTAATRICFSRYASDENMRILAQAVIDEPDIGKKAALLYTFANREFSVCHGALIEYSKSDDEWLRFASFGALANCRSEDVKSYAVDLLLCGQHTSEAIMMLITNYTSGDKKLLLSSLKRLKIDFGDDSGWHGASIAILEAFDKNIPLPRECLMYIYENTLCSCCRERAVKLLEKHKWLTDDIICECRYDSNNDTADYIRRRYPEK